jgi:hypothetical protein
MRIRLVCQHCAQPFEVHPCRANKGAKYCSQSCYQPNRTKSFTERFWLNVDKHSSPGHCWLWTGLQDGHGYGTFHIAGRKMILAHRFSYEALFGRLLPGICVCHHCDVPLCVNPDHLFAGSKADNAQDCKAKQRNNYGHRNGNARLTPIQVSEILALQYSLTGKELAKRFNISPSVISSIKHHKAWAHLLNPLSVDASIYEH